MKTKSYLPILLLITTFVISGCGTKREKSSFVPSKPEESSVSSISSAETTSSQETTSNPVSSSIENVSSVAVSSKESSSIQPAESSSVQPSSSMQESSSIAPSSSELPPEPEYLKKDVVVQLDASLRYNEDKTPYDLTFAYDDELFLTDAKVYNKDLSMLSFAASIATANKTRGDAFFSELQFNDVITHDYDKEPTEDTMGYYMAHKTIDNYELITVAFRGFEYQKEWANNFIIGKTGDHEGFSARAAEAHAALKEYIDTYLQDKELKLWINGYSRAGALSNSLSNLILQDHEIPITLENMFVYTFEAPASLCEENIVPYENIHNINNEADLITFVPPESYGLKRFGIDYPIYDINVDTLVKEFDEHIDIPRFQSIESLTHERTNSDTDVRDYVLNQIFNKEVDEYTSEDVYANTREQYVDNYQDGLSSSIGYVFALTPETRSALLNDFSNLGFSALLIISDKTGASFKDFLTPYLDQDGIAYDDDELLADCAIFIKAAQNLFMSILLMYSNDEYKGSITRLIDMHYPETTYVLLKHAHEKE